MTYYHLTVEGRLVTSNLPFTYVYPNLFNYFLAVNSLKPMLAFENLYRELMRLSLTNKLKVSIKDDVATFKACNDNIKVPYDTALEILRMQPEGTTLDDLLFELENA